MPVGLLSLALVVARLVGLQSTHCASVPSGLGRYASRACSWPSMVEASAMHGYAVSCKRSEAGGALALPRAVMDGSPPRIASSAPAGAKPAASKRSRPWRPCQLACRVSLMAYTPTRAWNSIAVMGSDAASHDSPACGDRSYWGHCSGEWSVLRSYLGSYAVSYPECQRVDCSESVHSCARPTSLLCLCRGPYWQVEKRIGEARKPGPPGDIDDPNAAYDIDEHDGDGIGIGHGAVSQPEVELGVIVNEAFTRSLGQRCFVHSVAFKGARPGAVFKMGEQGLLYYRAPEDRTAPPPRRLPLLVAS